MNLTKETILGAMIVEMVETLKISDFLSRFELLFRRYVDYSKMTVLIENAEPKENWEIIQKARELALGGFAVQKDSQRKPLCCIFSNLSLDGKYPAKKYYMPEVLDMKKVMPVSKVEKNGYDKLVQGFCDELESCMQSPPLNFDSFLVVMDTLLKKYFWSNSASDKKDEDVSLYEYIKTTTAITSVLVQKCKERAPYMLAAGHFSGIQNYIFAVSKVGTGGVSKRLRARSFYVNAMVSALSHYIIHKFGLPMVNILMLTGGKFYILLPNTEDAEKRLQKIEQQITEFLYKKFRGTLSLELVWKEMTDEKLRNYSDTIRSLSKKIEEKKKRLLEGILVKDGEWNQKQFVVYQDLVHKSMCTACRSALVDEGQKMCTNCQTDTEIGAKLPKIEMFSFSRMKGQYKLLDNYYLNLDVSIGGDQNYLIMKLNDSTFDHMYNKPISIYYGINNVPLQPDGEVKTFEEIASKAKGSKKLGILKADVDTLGFLFSEGLREREDQNISISRINTLSHMLDLFFGGYLHQMIKLNYPNVYCVFSGGDDLFFIGPWSDMPNLILDINHAFHKYTSENNCVTLSAAIYITESGGHISTFANQCEAKLEQVKQRADSIISPDKIGRNGVYFLGKIMSWEDFKNQIESGLKFAEAEKKVGTGVIRRLETYSSMYQEFLKSGDADNLLFLPLFSRDLEPNCKTFQKEQDFFNNCKELYQRVSNYRKIDKEFYYVEFCARYALLLTKEERKNG